MLSERFPVGIRLALVLLVITPIMASCSSFFDYQGYVERADTLIIAKLLPEYKREFHVGPQFDGSEGQTLVVTGLDVVYIEKSNGKTVRSLYQTRGSYWQVVMHKSVYDENLETDYQVWVLDYAWFLVGPEANPIIREDYPEHQDIMGRWMVYAE